MNESRVARMESSDLDHGRETIRQIASLVKGSTDPGIAWKLGLGCIVAKEFESDRLACRTHSCLLVLQHRHSRRMTCLDGGSLPDGYRPREATTFEIQRLGSR